MTVTVVWDPEDEPEGNVQHCLKHEVTKAEVLQVFQNPIDVGTSDSSGRPVVYGETATGRHLIVVFEVVDEDCIYPITAYDVPRRKR